MFLVSLMTSGISSSVVGTMAGQMIMQGFVGFNIPIWVRRLVTMVPAFVIVAIGVNPTNALVLSQVVLSFGIPLAIIPLVRLTSRKDVLGVHVNKRGTTIIAWTLAVAIVAINIFLIYQQFFLS